MPLGVAKTAVWSNNPNLQSLFIETSFPLPTKFSDYKPAANAPYVLVLVDLAEDMSDISQKMISIYDHCVAEKKKLTVAIIHQKIVDTEKNQYFSQLLSQVGGPSPLHRLVFVKDLYQEGFQNGDTWLERWIIESLVERKICISTKGENYLFPLSVKDFVSALQKIMFLSGTAGESFWLVGEPITDLELGYLLKKNLEDDGEPFEIESTEANLSVLDLNSLGNQSRAKLNWEPVDEFSQELKASIKRLGEDRSLLISRLHHEKAGRRSVWLQSIIHSIQKLAARVSGYKLKKTGEKGTGSSKDLLVRWVETVFVSALTIYFLITVIFIGFTYLSLKKMDESLNFARNGQVSASVKSLAVSIKYTKVGEAGYQFVSPIFSSLAPGFHEKNHNLFVFLHYSQSSLENLQQTYLLAEKIYLSIGDSKANLNYIDASLALRSNLSQVYENINQISLLSQDGKLPDILEKRLNNSPEFKNVALIEQQITQLFKTVELVPAILGGDSYKNVVLVLQNSSELRSTGGVIEYLLTLVLDHGRVVSRNIYTGADIDVLVGKEVVAPPLISRYTGTENWKLRDLNYNPDFISTATNLSAVINKALKFKPDVVIALNESFLASLLQESQGLVLDGQNYTAENLSPALIQHTPSPLYKKMIEYYLDQLIGHRLSLPSFGRVLAKQTQENQILFWTADNSAEKTLIDQPFSGGVFPQNCHPAISGPVPCIAETTYLNESNFSLVPVGGNLQKKVLHKVSFAQKSIEHEYLVDYRFKESIPNLNRDLSQIIQLYAPTGSILNEVLINERRVVMNSVVVQQDNRLQRFQIPLPLKFNSDNHLSIKFSSPLPEELRLPFSYSLTEYRQPGLSPLDGLVQLVIEVPMNSRAVLMTASATSSPTSYSYIYPSKTSTFGIRFEPKAR